MSIMMSTCTIQLSTFYYDLFYLQKKIYVASKKCNKSMIYSLQKLLIHSYSIQSLAKYLVLKMYSLRKARPSKLALLLFNNNKYNSVLNKLVQKESNQYVVYWCLYPEWLAKKESSELSAVNDLNRYLSQQTYLVSHKTQKIYHYFCSEQSSNICVKHFDKTYLISKLQTIQWIKYKISDWLLNQCMQEINIDASTSIKTNIQIYNNLYCLLKQILLTGIEWISLQQNTNRVKEKVNFCNIINIFSQYILITLQYKALYCIQIKLNKFLYNIGTLKFKSRYKHSFNSLINNKYINFISISLQTKKIALTKLIYVNINLQTCKLIMRYLKSFFYHKDKYHQLKLNTYLNYQQVKNMLHKQLRQIYKIYHSLLSSRELLYIHTLTNNIVYKWTKKILSKQN